MGVIAVARASTPVQHAGGLRAWRGDGGGYKWWQLEIPAYYYCITITTDGINITLELTLVEATTCSLLNSLPNFTLLISITLIT